MPERVKRVTLVDEFIVPHQERAELTFRCGHPVDDIRLRITIRDAEMLHRVLYQTLIKPKFERRT